MSGTVPGADNLAEQTDGNTLIPGQRRKLLDGAFRTGKAQLTKTPQVTVRSREVILSAHESQWRLSGRAVIGDFI